MKDSILKGTGNSRFLKSAVPAGTSWADALAMLQAGTFPIDFNGINTEGFQQVGTPLNKANLLKDATAAQIGLPPSTTPDGMFLALGNTGELHVWRKTVTTSQEIPAGYTLGAETNTKLCYMYYTDGMSVSYASSVSIDDAGNVSLVSPSSISFNSQDVNNVAITKGKFVKFTATNSSNIATPGVYFIPTDATLTYVRSGTSANPGLYCDKAQLVTGYAKVPAGTTTTYPVSTNPNAYQEGDDAKPAGYTLGEVVSGSYLLGSANSGQNYYYKTATSLFVSDDGTLSMPSNAEQVNLVYSANGLTSDHIKSSFAGKFVQLSSTGADLYYNSLFKTTPSEILFIPHEAIITKGSDKCFYIDRYQPVTGYAAIPAGTTIEYLGKLGNKARVQVLSYVGTGTYGSSNPNSLTFDFPPKFFAIMCDDNHYGRNAFAIRGANYMGYQFDGNSNANIITWEGAKFSWYHYDGANKQYNASGKTYYAIAIG